MCTDCWTYLSKVVSLTSRFIQESVSLVENVAADFQEYDAGFVVYCVARS